MLAPLDQQVPMVATKDIGEMVAALLNRPEAAPRFVELEGPRRYAPIDVAAAFTSVLERPVEANILPANAWNETYRSWGLTPKSAVAMSEMLAGFNDRHIVFEHARDDTIHGDTTLEAVLATLNAK